MSYAPGTDGEEPTEFFSVADFTPETAEANPDWTIDLCDEVVGTWRGEQGKAAEMTLIWGRPMVEGAAVATAELADLAVDQCVLVEGRFTLLAPDAYRGDTLDVRLFDRRWARSRASRCTPTTTRTTSTSTDGAARSQSGLTRATRPPVTRTSASGAIANTARGVPAAAHTTS